MITIQRTSHGFSDPGVYSYSIGDGPMVGAYKTYDEAIRAAWAVAR